MTEKTYSKKILVLLGSPRKKGNSTTQDAFRYVGAKMAGMVYGSAEKPGEIKSNQALMQEAEALGQKLAKR
jgi:hypothetical protein